MVGEAQQTKMAAIEAMWETEPAPAGLNLIALPNEAEMKNDFEIKLPWVMGLIGTRSVSKEIPGIIEIKAKNLDIKKSDFIPIATKFGFTFHSCNSDYILLVKVLKENAIVPNLANHTLGVGAVVINSKNEILLIKEIIRNEYYKLPGGHIDDAEMISQALSREVFEETGVVVDFERIISIGHFYPHQFHKSNLYVLCLAKPKSLKIDVKDKEEISEAIWLDLDEMFKRDDIHDYTKTIVKSALSGQGLYKSETPILSHLKNEFELFFVK